MLGSSVQHGGDCRRRGWHQGMTSSWRASRCRSLRWSSFSSLRMNEVCQENSNSLEYTKLCIIYRSRFLAKTILNKKPGPIRRPYSEAFSLHLLILITKLYEKTSAFIRFSGILVKYRIQNVNIRCVLIKF